MKGGYYADLARNQRLRVLPIRAPRGAILDRHGRILVDSRPIYDVVVSREDLGEASLKSVIDPVWMALGLDPGYLRERLAEIADQAAWESIVIKENASCAGRCNS